MSDSSRHHPDTALLQDFVSGALPMGVNLAVSSHVDRCDWCQQLIPGLTHATSQAWMHNMPDDEKNATADLGDIFDRIVSQTATQASSRDLESRADQSETDDTVSLRDRPVRLPSLLRKIARGGLTWKGIASGIHQALLDVDAQTKCEFIYMDTGARVPRHSHLGNEFMLVLDGTLSDEFGDYAAGDFVARHQRDCHGQLTEGGCICLFVTDAPLIFREGLARFLNPVNRIRFWWSKLGVRAESVS